MEILELAIQIACEAHSGQKDRDGNPYILHPLHVGLQGLTDEEKATGFLHDVLEDSEITADKMIERGIPTSVVNALKLLCHNNTESYTEYLQRIIDSKNPLAIRVKYYDLCQNYERGKKYEDLQKKHSQALELIRPVFEKMDRVEPVLLTPSVAVFACGCFWGVEHMFRKVKGVRNVIVGYSGKEKNPPSYRTVRSGLTSMKEAVLIEYDKTVVNYRDLCKLFFEIHDPAQTDGQGSDIGQQYRSAIFYNGEEQKQICLELIEILRQKGYEVNTILEPVSTFWKAEEYHQAYYEHTGGSPYCHLRQKKF